MKASITLLCALVARVAAHATVYGLWVNDAFQGDGRNVYVRSPQTNSPIKDVTLAAINCNTNNRKVPESVSVKGGDKLTFEWFHDNRGDDIIAPSHKGPVTVYVAELSTDGTGGVWSKIYEDGLSGGKWAVDKLIASKGKHSLTVPTWIAQGDYLFRAEIIALHESDTDYTQNSGRGTQFYPSCSQVKITSGGSTAPGQNFNFVGGYKHDDPGILYNLYASPVPPYTVPGPPVWDPKSEGVTPPKDDPTTPEEYPTKTKTTPTTTPATDPTPNSPPGRSDPIATPADSGNTSYLPVEPAKPAKKYDRCGGSGYIGSTECPSGLTCTKVSECYSYCT